MEYQEWIPPAVRVWHENLYSEHIAPAAAARRDRLASDLRLRPLYERLTAIPLDGESWGQILFAADDVAYFVSIGRRTADARTKFRGKLVAIAKMADKLADELEALEQLELDANVALPLEITAMPFLLCEAGKNNALFQTQAIDEVHALKRVNYSAIPENNEIVRCLAAITRHASEQDLDTLSPELDAVLNSRKLDPAIAGFVRAFDTRFSQAQRVTAGLAAIRIEHDELGALAAVALDFPMELKKASAEHLTGVYFNAVRDARRAPRRRAGGTLKDRTRDESPSGSDIDASVNLNPWLHGQRKD